MLRLNLRPLLKQHQKTMHEVAQVAGAPSWPTVHKYVAQPAKVQHLSLESLYDLLSAGLGMSDEEIAALPLGALFTIDGSEEEAAE